MAVKWDLSWEMELASYTIQHITVNFRHRFIFPQQMSQFIGEKFNETQYYEKNNCLFPNGKIEPQTVGHFEVNWANFLGELREGKKRYFISLQSFYLGPGVVLSIAGNHQFTRVQHFCTIVDITWLHSQSRYRKNTTPTIMDTKPNRDHRRTHWTLSTYK